MMASMRTSALEAATGIEPVYRALQTPADPTKPLVSHYNLSPRGAVSERMVSA